MIIHVPAHNIKILKRQVVAIMSHAARRHAVAGMLLRHLPINPFQRPVQARYLSTTNSCSKGLRHDEHPHDHRKMWVVEKATSAIMVGLIPMGLLFPCTLFDLILAILISAHTLWGLEAVSLEYARTIIVGKTINLASLRAMQAISAFILGGLFFLSLNDIGLCRGFWRVWSNMRK